MIVDAIRLLAGWLSDPDTGINAQLDQLPRLDAENAPCAVTVYNEIDDPWVARGEVPRSLWIDEKGDPRRLLMVRLHPDPEGFVAQVLPELEDPAHWTVVPLVCIAAARKIERPNSTVTVADLVRDNRQIMRTTFRVIAQHFDSINTRHELNDVTFELPGPAGLRLNSQLLAPISDVEIDGLEFPIRAQDRWALGIT